MLRKRLNLGLGAAALVLLLSGGIGRADGPGCGADGACATDGCCKTCIPTPVTKKVVLRHYGEKCEDFCVCKPTFLGGLFNLQEAREKDSYLYVGRGPGDQPCCGGCAGCANCGQPRVKKFLVIHNREFKECQVQCLSPDQLAAATAAGTVGGPASAPGTPMAAPGERPFAAPPSLEPQRGPIQGNVPGTTLPGPAR